MIIGIFFAVAACGLWALAFVSPVVLEEFSPILVALGRYAAFGLLSLVLVPLMWRDLRRLKRVDWATAAILSSIGNIVYYVLLASAIQRIDVPGPTVVIGLLPLTIPLFANWRCRELPWRDLIVPLLAIGSGLFFVNAHEYHRFALAEGLLVYAIGIGLAVASLVSWTWYGVANTSWLRSHPYVTAAAWTVAQGVTILPLVMVGVVGWIIWNSTEASATMMANMTNADTIGRFFLVSAIVGLGSSWLATFCWNHASRRLLITLAGQLLVFETIAAIIYGHVYRGEWPAVDVSLGVALLCGGVALGVRAVQNHRIQVTT